LLQSVDPNPSSGQLDRESHAPADFGHDCGLRIAKVEVRATCYRALDEQL